MPSADKSSHNKRLNALLKEVDAATDQAQSKADLLSQAQKLCDFGDPLKFDQRVPLGLTAVGLVLMGAAWYLMQHGVASGRSVPVWVFVAGLLLSIIGIVMMLSRRAKLENLSQKMVRQCMLIDYGMTLQGNLAATFANLEQQYNDFRRGNYQRELRSCIAGAYQGARLRSAYRYAHLHFVDKVERLVTYTDGQGRRRTRIETSYEHHDRYYLLLAFPWVKGIALSADSTHRIRMPVASDTTDREFNRRFTFTGMTEMACARFAIPVTVLLMPKFCEMLQKPNFTFSEKGELCLSFNNSDLLNSNINADIRFPKVFYKALESGTRLAKFDALMALLYQLMDQHDSNFV